MDLINRVLSGGLVGVLPLVAILLASAGGYFILKQGRTDLIDSPWFWAFAFSTVGLLGVWAISGKYDDRQKRVEARYEARQRIAVDLQRGSGSADDSAASQPGYSSERRVPLHFLGGGLVIVAAVSVVMLCRTGRNKTSTARATTDEPR